MAKIETKSREGRANKGSKPGERRGGRQKGVPNKTTTMLKEAILNAAEAVGYDGKGKDGLEGYLTSIAMTEPKAFTTLLGKVLPMQVTGDASAPFVVQITRGLGD